MKNWAESAARDLAAVREKKPLVHCITNLVSMNYTANALLAMGAAPVMAHARNEVEEMVSRADALVLNIGTLTESWLESMIAAGHAAAGLGLPVILDPVGSGATALRTTAAKRILSRIDVRVVRGNASEILALSETQGATRGVDAVHSVADAFDTAFKIAAGLQTTLAVTGPMDMVTDGRRIVRVHNGHPLMAYVTGIGCAVTAAVAAFSTVDTDPLSAAVAALAFVGLCGEVAARTAAAPGNFAVEVLDALYTVTPEMLATHCKIETWN
jgi:hydroxyethylthiazole kinase